MKLRRLSRLLVLIVAVLLVSRVAVRWGKPRVVARLGGELLAPPTAEADRGALTAWIERRPTGAVVRYLSGLDNDGIAVAEVGSGLSVWGDRIVITEIGRDGVQLRSVGPGPTQWAPRALASSPASSIAGGGTSVCWLTSVRPALPAAPFVAAGAGGTAVLAFVGRDAQPTPIHTSFSAGSLELIGLDHDTAYWLERSSRAGEDITTIRRRALQGGEPETVVEERGRQNAVLFRDKLLWTAYSQESASLSGATSVKVRELSGGEPRVIADWLRQGVHLGVGSDAVYAMDEEHTWRLGDRRGEQQPIYDGYLGSPLRAVAGSYEYLVTSDGSRQVLVRRGLTWGARLRSALGI